MQLTTKQKKVAVRIVVAAVCVLLLNLFEVEGWLRLALFLGVYAIIGGDIVAKAFRGIMHGRVFDENFLMLMATVGAFALAIVEGSGDYNEAIAVMLFYQIGEFFQSRAVAKSRDRIMSLMDIRPDYANIENDGAIVRVDPDDIEVGQTI
ncbi:MAG: heavy metal translocating P-type ATPase, partial [Bacteroidales bacterium]|nr:heavy metal translocating P-type ATPase [Candidatus Sodaliphilus aphodohippi]